MGKEKFSLGPRLWVQSKTKISLKKHSNFQSLTSEAPHIDRGGVGQAENDLGRPIESALYVGVYGLVLVAGVAEVDHFDRAGALVLEEDIFRFQIAVQDLLVVEQLQALEYGDGKPLDQVHTETLVVVFANQLVHIHAQQLERDADVPPEDEIVKHVNHVVLIVRVLLQQMPQDLDLAWRLLVEALLVSQHLQGDLSFLFVVEHLDHLGVGRFGS